MAITAVRRRRRRLLVRRSAARALDAGVHAPVGRPRRTRSRRVSGPPSRYTTRTRATFRTSDPEPDMRHVVPGPPLRQRSTIWNASSGFALRGFRPIVLRAPWDDPEVWPWEDRDEPGHYVFIRFFGNTIVDDVRIPNNLAVLLRTRRLREIDPPVGLGHAWRLARRQAPALPRRHHGRRPRRHRRLRRRRRLDGAQQARRHVRRPAVRACGFRHRGGRVARRRAPALPRRPHRRRPRRHRRLRRRRRLRRAQQRRRHLRRRRSSSSPTSATRPAAGASTSTRASSPTSPATAAPTSSASATPASTSRSATATARFQFRPIPVLDDFGLDAGGWHVDKHPRFLADITGDGRADIIGFGDAGVYVALSNGDGTLRRRRSSSSPTSATRPAAGASTSTHACSPTSPATAAPTSSASATPASTSRSATATAASSSNPVPVLADFGLDAGGWRVDKHPRFLADITGDGRADIIGFGDAGVYVALSNGDGTLRTRPVHHRRFRLRGRRLAHRQTPTPARRHHRRRPRRHRRLRRRRRLRRPQQRRRHLPATAHVRDPELRGR